MKEMFDSYDRIVKNLIIQVRKNVDGAFEEILQIYAPLITSFVNRLGNQDSAPLEEDDVRQELTVTFYNAVLSYDLTQNEVSFGLYAKICLNNALITLLRAQKNRKGPEIVSLEDEAWVIDGGEDNSDPSAEWIRREETRELNRRIEQTLSAFENKVWSFYLAGCSSREIALALDKNEKSIDNAIFRVRRKLIQLLAQ